MQIVVDEIIHSFGPDCTIILAGSFGRGEGSIRLNKNNIATPLNDYDVYVITDRNPTATVIIKTEDNILQRLSELTGSDLGAEKFVVGVETIPRGSLTRLLPDISTYEMKAASHVLYGVDVRNQIPVTKETIALASGAITLYHRNIALLENVEPEYLQAQNYPVEARLETVRESCKVYTEICTSLSLLGGFYEPSYRDRAQLFGKNFQNFPELVAAIPDLDQKITERTEMKISSDFSPIIDHAYETWIAARHDLRIAQQYFLGKMLNLESASALPQFLAQAEARLGRFFFLEYLSSYLRTRHLKDVVPLGLVNAIFQIYDNYSFRNRLLDSGNDTAMPRFSRKSPIANIYLGTMATLYGLGDHGNVETNLLETAEKFADKIFPVNTTSKALEQRWKIVRDLMLKIQKLYFVREKKRGA
jgi:hypothetical protein